MTPAINQWAQRHGITADALTDLHAVLMSAVPQPSGDATGSEAAAQQRIRLEAPHHGVRLWRNNVGATPSSEQHQCPYCHNHFTEQKQPVRYGLANESTAMNKVVKSHDLIGITPMTVKPEHVGGILGIFTSIECKRPGWQYKGTTREIGQLNWAQIVIGLGGFAQFATDPGEVWS